MTPSLAFNGHYDVLITQTSKSCSINQGCDLQQASIGFLSQLQTSVTGYNREFWGLSLAKSRVILCATGPPIALTPQCPSLSPDRERERGPETLQILNAILRSNISFTYQSNANHPVTHDCFWVESSWKRELCLEEKRGQECSPQCHQLCFRIKMLNVLKSKAFHNSWQFS